MRNELLVGAVFAAALALPLVANGQDRAGPTNWVRIFDRSQAYGPGLPAYPSSNYSSLARYDLRVSLGATPKKK
jgi:hypothetical protein